MTWFRPPEYMHNAEGVVEYMAIVAFHQEPANRDLDDWTIGEMWHDLRATEQQPYFEKAGAFYRMFRAMEQYGAMRPVYD